MMPHPNYEGYTMRNRHETYARRKHRRTMQRLGYASKEAGALLLMGAALGLTAFAFAWVIFGEWT